VNQQIAATLRNNQRLLAGVSFFVACYVSLIYTVLIRNYSGIALSGALLMINFLALRWANPRQARPAQAAARNCAGGARRYIAPALVFLNLFLFLTPSSFAQNSGDPVIICEYCNGDGTSGTPPDQPPSGTPTGTTGYATGTNAAGQTVQFPVGTFPSNQVSGLNPIDPANAAKIGVPVGWTITGQDAQGNPVLQRPDGSYTIIYTSHPQITGTATAAQSATPAPVSPPWEAGLPSAQIQKLMDLVRELVPYMRRQIERPLLEKFTFLAMILSSIILLFSFIRVIRENDGA
jgi:hypothetical protein